MTFIFSPKLTDKSSISCLLKAKMFLFFSQFRKLKDSFRLIDTCWTWWHRQKLNLKRKIIKTFSYSSKLTASSWLTGARCGRALFAKVPSNTKIDEAHLYISPIMGTCDNVWKKKKWNARTQSSRHQTRFNA